MSLDNTQKATVAKWIQDGAKLAEIQDRIQKDFGTKMTYMEVRFLVDDLKVIPKDPEPPKVEPKPEVAPAPAEAEAAPEAVPDADAPPAGAGKVVVGVDQLALPGAMVSGKVTFSDGKQAQWYLDQNGRLGVVPPEKGYKPSQADVQEFQVALERELARMGM